MGSAFDLSVLDIVETELADVEAALQRLEDGTYATCERCSGPIDEARLEESPLTRLCREHGTASSQGRVAVLAGPQPLPFGSQHRQ